MADTYADILEKLRALDEITLLELLELTSEDIVARCQDIIEQKIDDLLYKLEDEQEED